MKRNTKSWYNKVFRTRRPGSKFNWFGKAKKSAAKAKSFRVLDPETLPANVANRNLNTKPENPGQPESRPVPALAAPSGMPSGHPEKKARSKRKKLLAFVGAFNINLGGFNLRTSVYSLGMFILSYLFIYFLYQFSTIFVASFYGIDAVLYYYEVYFPIGNASNLWNGSNVIAITIAGPLACALVSLLFFRKLSLSKSLSAGSSVFLYWAAFHGAAHFLGAFVGGVVTNEGMGFVANWMFMGVFFKILLSLIFLFFLGLTGYYVPCIAIINLTSEKSKPINRLSNSLSVDIVPWILATILLWLFKRPDKIPQHELIQVYDTIILVSMLFALVAKAFSTWRPKIIHKFRFTTIQNRNGLWLLTSALLTLIFLRFILADGIHFIVRMSFSAGFYK
jgi:hypothetical protein